MISAELIYLLDSFVFIFLLTGGANLLNVWNDALLLQAQDLVFVFCGVGSYMRSRVCWKQVGAWQF